MLDLATFPLESLFEIYFLDKVKTNCKRFLSLGVAVKLTLLTFDFSTNASWTV